MEGVLPTNDYAHPGEDWCYSPAYVGLIAEDGSQLSAQNGAINDSPPLQYLIRLPQSPRSLLSRKYLSYFIPIFLIIT
jgi:hypothetical protein